MKNKTDKTYINVNIIGWIIIAILNSIKFDIHSIVIWVAAVIIILLLMDKNNGNTNS
jgi:hypothetical protein